MKELIKVENKNGKQIVSCRDLYEGLELNKAHWKRWSVKNIIENEYFKEGEDWVGFTIMVNGNETQDFAITLEFAKHIAMMARTEKSHQYRNYFLECERKLKEMVDPKAQLLLEIYNGGQGGVLAAKQLTEIEVREATQPLLDKIEEDKPKVTFADRVLRSKDNILVRQLAKIASDEGYKIGDRKLYNNLRQWGYVLKGSTEPSQRAIDSGYFVIKVSTIDTPYGIKETKTTLVTPKGQIKIVEKLLKELNK